jgi:hypothetical protein
MPEIVGKEENKRRPAGLASNCACMSVPAIFVMDAFASFARVRLRDEKAESGKSHEN